MTGVQTCALPICADLARVRGSARDEIERLEAERLASGVGTVLAPVLGAENPAEAFLSGNLAVQRSVIDVLMTVTLRPQKQGRKGFDPGSVEIAWK